jgi:hypothetical protein
MSLIGLQPESRGGLRRANSRRFVFQIGEGARGGRPSKSFVAAWPVSQRDSQLHRSLRNPTFHSTDQSDTTGRIRHHRTIPTICIPLLVLRRWERDPGGPPVTPRTFGFLHEFVVSKSHIPSLQYSEDHDGGRIQRPTLRRPSEFFVDRSRAVYLSSPVNGGNNT